MRIALLIFSFGFFLASDCLAARRDGMELQMFGRYMRESTKFSTTGVGDANYAGTGIGVGSLLKFSNRERYGFALKGGFISRKGDNTANTSDVQESISSSVYDVGVRFYALDAYFGLSGIYSPIRTSYRADGALIVQKYNGIGAGLELGVDLFLGDTVFLSPKIEYQTISAQPGVGTPNPERLTNFGVGIGLGLSF